MTPERDVIDITVGGSRNVNSLLERLENALNTENIPLLENYLEENPTDFTAMFKLANRYRVLYNADGLEKAKRLYEKIINNPDSTRKLKIAVRTDGSKVNVLESVRKYKIECERILEMRRRR